MNYVKIIICTLCWSFLICGCQSKLLTVYKIDVQQGNALEAESIEKIQLGMSKEQVHFVLGTPLINDSFHPDRWDYIYHFTPGYGEQQRRQLTLIFDRDEVIDIYKHNIIKDDVTIAKDNENNDDDKIQNAGEQASKGEKAEKEQEKLEKQAEELEQILETNKDPTN